MRSPAFCCVGRAAGLQYLIRGTHCWVLVALGKAGSTKVHLCRFRSPLLLSAARASGKSELAAANGSRRRWSTSPPPATLLVEAATGDQHAADARYVIYTTQIDRVFRPTLCQSIATLNDHSGCVGFVPTWKPFQGPPRQGAFLFELDGRQSPDTGAPPSVPKPRSPRAGLVLFQLPRCLTNQ
jgi:hypothetical protein